MVEVALVIPDGSRRPRSRRQFLSAAAAWPELQHCRPDRRANLMAFIAIYARWASWTDTGQAGPRGTSWVTRSRLCKLARFSASTFKTCRRIWERAGFIATVREGRTEMARAMTKRRDVEAYDGNDAKVIILLIPAKRTPVGGVVPAQDGSCPPKVPSLRQETPTREAQVWKTPDSQDRGRTALRAGPPPATRTPARSPVPVQLAGHAVLAKLSEDAIGAMWRPFRDRGWTPSAWLWAINHRPDGRAHRRALASVHRPAGWLRWRLDLWRDPDGTPMLSIAQRAAVRRLAEHQQRAAAALPPQRAAAAPNPDYLEARSRDHRLKSRQKGRS